MSTFESMFEAIENLQFYDWLISNGSKLSKVELLRILKEYVYQLETYGYDVDEIVDRLSIRFPNE